MQEETTNQVLESLASDIAMEISDAHNQRDGSAAALVRLGNALTRNIARRAAAELADQE
jgi:hypothetical protein